MPAERLHKTEPAVLKFVMEARVVCGCLSVRGGERRWGVSKGVCVSVFLEMRYIALAVRGNVTSQ